MKTENLAIVFVDIVGFTPRTSKQTREQNERMLQRFADVVKPLVRRANGRVVKSMGDAFLMTFRSPTDALLCTMAIHDSLAQSNAGLDDSERFDIRAALNVGDVRIEAGDVFGEAVNIAARIEGKAGPGEIIFSEAVYLSMTKSEIPSEEVGLKKLKGITDKVRLYRVPRATESGGYRIAAAGEPTESATDLALVPAELPFGGLGLQRLTRGSDTRDIVIDRLQGGVGRAGHYMSLARQHVGVWWSKFITEFRKSQRVRMITAIAGAVLLGIMVWSVWPSPKPVHKKRNAFQRLKHDLGF